MQLHNCVQITVTITDAITIHHHVIVHPHSSAITGGENTEKCLEKSEILCLFCQQNHAIYARNPPFTCRQTSNDVKRQWPSELPINRRAMPPLTDALISKIYRCLPVSAYLGF